MQETKNQEVLIRPYQDSEKEEVLHLLRLNTPAYFAASEEKDLIHYLDHEVEYFYVMLIGKEIVGCGGINILHKGAEARLSWDIFHPSHQKKGLGSELTRFRIKKIQTFPNVKRLIVRTSQQAFHFYKKQGFEVLEIQKDHWAPGFDMYVMIYKSPFPR